MTTERDPTQPPRVINLHAAVKAVLASKGYSAQVDSDLRAAIETRLGVLSRRAIGKVFQCSRDAPAFDQLLIGPCLVELASLPDDQAALLTLFLLTAIREWAKATPWTGPNPRLVIILEEAHNLVGRSTAATVSAENAEPKVHASAYLCRMLAELRALGVVIIILDQLASAIAPEVVKITGSKLALRQVDAEDREILGGAMLFGAMELEEIARFGPGDAYFHTERYFGPQRIRTPNLKVEWNLPQPAVDRAIQPFLREDDWFIQAANVRVGEEMQQLMAAEDEFERRCTQAAAEKTKLMARHAQTLIQPVGARRNEQLAELARRAGSLRDELKAAARQFRWEVFGPLLADEPPAGVLDEPLATLRAQLIERFETVIVPAVQFCVDGLTALAERCNGSLQVAGE